MAVPLPLQLRPMVVADIPAVMAIETAVYSAPFSAAGYEYELTRNQLAHYSVLVEGDGPDEILIGYGGFWLIAGEAHISTIAVRPEWAGQGRGALLLIHLLQQAIALEATEATLEVRRSNQPAQALYARYGFAYVGERRRYYRNNNEDALLMTVAPLDAAYQAQLRRWKTALQRRLERVMDEG